MSNKAFDTRLQRMSSFFLFLGRPLAVWVFLLTLVRLVFWFSFPESFRGESGMLLAKAFFIGARFDLLIIGFFLIPVLLVWLSALFSVTVERGAFFLSQLWLILVWWISITLSTASWFFFSVQSRHLTFHDLPDLGFLKAGLGKAGLESTVLVIAIFLCLAVLGSRQIFRLKPVLKEGPRENIWRRGARILGPVLIVALMARGTVTAHHLEKQHSEISKNPALNQLILNAVWAFDKNF